MTAGQARLTPTSRTGVAPATAASLTLIGAVLLNLVIVEVLFFAAPAPKNTLIGIGQILGLHLALLLLLQLVLISRLPWLDRRIGMDVLTSWHRLTGLTIFWIVLLHPTFVILGYRRQRHQPVLRVTLDLAGQIGVLTGIVAAAIVLVGAGLSIRAARRRLSYEAWHAIHFCMYAAIALALIHQFYEGSAFKTSALATAYWWAVGIFALGSLLVGRVALPLWRNYRHRYRVAAVVPESDTVVSVYVTGRDLDRLPARAGQFFIWRFLGPGHWWEANPFSLSAAPDGRSLRLTAKAVGSTSAGLRHVPVGTRVFAEGPYGAFTALHRTREATLLIAGGVGVTPIRSLFEELTGDIIVLYRVHTMAEAVLLQELQELARIHGAQVHVLTGRTGAGSPPNAPFEPNNLQALVPDLADRDVYVCGPAAMTTAVLASLRELRVPRRQVHAERFRLAG